MDGQMHRRMDGRSVGLPVSVSLRWMYEDTDKGRMNGHKDQTIDGPGWVATQKATTSRATRTRTHAHTHTHARTHTRTHAHTHKHARTHMLGAEPGKLGLAMVHAWYTVAAVQARSHMHTRVTVWVRCARHMQHVHTVAVVYTPVPMYVPMPE